MQHGKSNNNNGTDTGQEVSIATFYPSDITLFLLAKFISVVFARGVDGICKILDPSSIQVSPPMY